MSPSKGKLTMGKKLANKEIKYEKSTIEQKNQPSKNEIK
jgi:hypothetical protein